MADPQQLVINSATPIASGRFYYKLDTNQGTYYYTPTEFLNQGLLQGNSQFFESGFIRNPDITKNLKSIEIAPGLLQDKITGLYENANRGVLLTKDQASKILGGGKETFSDWGNDLNSGFVDVYDITQKNSNTGSPYGPIGGMGEFQGNLVYTRPTEANRNYSYITPYDQYDAGFSMRNTTVNVEKKGGLLGSLVRGVGNVFGSIPVIGDIAAYAIGGPALLGVVKGGQAASAGQSPMEAFKAGATSGALLGGLQGLTGAMQPTTVAGGGAGELASVGETGYGLTSPITPTAPIVTPIAPPDLLESAINLVTTGGGGTGVTAPTVPTVPSAFETAVNSALGGTTLGDFGSVGTGGFGTALPSAADVAASLVNAGFAPGTAANLAGLTAAGTGATNLLGGATALNPVAGTSGGLFSGLGDVLSNIGGALGNVASGVGNVLGQAGPTLSQLLSQTGLLGQSASMFGPSAPAAALANALASGLLTQQEINNLKNLGSNAQQQYSNLAQQAAEGASFTPYGVSTSLFNVSPTAKGIAANLTPQGQQLSDAALQAAMSSYQQAGTADLGQMAKERADLYQQLIGPEQERQRLATEARLSAQGRLGVGAGGGAYAPELRALQDAIAKQNLQIALQAPQEALAQRTALLQQGASAAAIPTGLAGQQLTAGQIGGQLGQAAAQTGVSRGQLLANTAGQGINENLLANIAAAQVASERNKAIGQALQGALGTGGQQQTTQGGSLMAGGGIGGGMGGAGFGDFSGNFLSDLQAANQLYQTGSGLFNLGSNIFSRFV